MSELLGIVHKNLRNIATPLLDKCVKDSILCLGALWLLDCSWPAERLEWLKGHSFPKHYALSCQPFRTTRRRHLREATGRKQDHYRNQARCFFPRKRG